MVAFIMLESPSIPVLFGLNHPLQSHGQVSCFS